MSFVTIAMCWNQVGGGAAGRVLLAGRVEGGELDLLRAEPQPRRPHAGAVRSEQSGPGGVGLGRLADGREAQGILIEGLHAGQVGDGDPDPKEAEDATAHRRCLNEALSWPFGAALVGVDREQRVRGADEQPRPVAAAEGEVRHRRTAP